MIILGIDPGNIESAYVRIEQADQRPLEIGKIANGSMLDVIALTDFDLLAVEMVASYGMPVGKEVFDTVLWTGRFVQHDLHTAHRPWQLVYRKPVALHHCHSARAKDPNVTRALVDRYTPGQRNYGKGTRDEPGWFHGFAGDIWQAYAVAVYVADTTDTEEEARWPSPALR